MSVLKDAALAEAVAVASASVAAGQVLLLRTRALSVRRLVGFVRPLLSVRNNRDAIFSALCLKNREDLQVGTQELIEVVGVDRLHGLDLVENRIDFRILRPLPSSLD